MPAGDAGLEHPWPEAEANAGLAAATREIIRLQAQLAAQQAVVDAAWQAVGGSMGGYVVLREALRALDKAAQPEGEPR